MAKRNHSERKPLTWIRLLAFGLLASMALATSVAPSHTAAQDIEEDEVDPEGNSEELESEKERLTILPMLEDTVSIADSWDTINGRLSRLEGEIVKAINADVTGDTETRNTSFKKADAEIRRLHREFFVESEFDPLVRTRNFTELGRRDSREVETWRPLSDYLARWMALLPAKNQISWGKDLEIDAELALEEIKRKNSRELAKQLAARYLYSPTGEAINDLAMRLAFSDGRLIDAAKIALRFRECRPIVFRQDSERQLYLMLALAGLGEEEMLAEEEAYVNEYFAAESFKVGEQELSFNQTRKAMTRAMGLQQASDEWVPPIDQMQRPIRMGAGEGWGAIPDEQFSAEPLVFKHGLVLPRVYQKKQSGNRYYSRRSQTNAIARDAELHWWKEYSPDKSIWLEFARPERAIYTTPGRRSYWYGGYNERPYTRVYGASYAEYYGKLESFKAPAQQSLLLATLANGGFSEQLHSGSRLQIWDLNADGRILAVLPLASDMPRIGREGIAIGEKWQMRLASMNFGSKPLCVGDRCYIMGSAVTGSSTETWAMAFSLSAKPGKPLGSLVWAKRLSAVSNMSARNRSILKIVPSTLVYKHRKLFAQTNGGVISCLDPENGDVDWSVKYETANKAPSYTWRSRTTTIENILSPSQPDIDGMSTVCAPTDSPSAYAISTFTGDLVRSIKGSDEAPFASFRYFLGAKDGLAYFQTASSIVSAPISFRSKALNEDGELEAFEGKHTLHLFNLREKGVPYRNKASLIGNHLYIDSGSSLYKLNRFSFETVTKTDWPEWASDLKDEKGNAIRPESYYNHENDIMHLTLIPADLSPDGRPMMMRSANRGALIYPIGEKKSE